MTDHETMAFESEIEAPFGGEHEHESAITPDEPTVVVPDRADAPVSEITERFLRAIVAQIPLERIEELHLFSPLRQSGVETGIAVVAARVPVTAPAMEIAPELPLSGEATPPTIDAVALHADAVDNVAVEADASDASVHASDASVDVSANDEVDSPYANEVVIADGAIAAEAIEHVDAMESADDESTRDADGTNIEVADVDHVDVADAEERAITESVDVSMAGADDEELDDVIDDSSSPAAPIVRHTVYTARYRLVQKGPERGKWEADVVAEADAPLITVETVVRGVQRRAGEESDTLRFSARQIAKALREPWPVA